MNAKRHLTLPIYRRVEEDLRTQVAGGRWLVGDLIPSRRELAEQYGVDLNTIQRSIAPLLADGTLEANPRHGTRVVRGKTEGSPRPDRVEALPEMRHVDAISMRRAPVEVVPAMVGIVTGLPPHTVPSTAVSMWDRMVLSAVERSFTTTHTASQVYSWWEIGGRPADAIAAALNDHVDAIVLIGLFDGDSVIAPALPVLERSGLPCVVVTHYELDCQLPHIYYDQVSAGYTAAQHLIFCGFQRIVFLVPFSDMWVEERVEGAARAVKSAGLPENALQVYRVGEAHSADVNQEELGYACGLGAIEAGLLESSGVIAPNDNAALGVMRAANDRRLKPGVNFGLVGFDETPAAGVYGLTSARPPFEAMGSEAGRMILRALRGEESNMKLCLRSTLVRRASTWSK